MSTMIVRLFVVVLIAQKVTPYPYYQPKFPNGNSIPHPCKHGKIWPGVGHILEGGGGYRNPFGLDFAAAGYTWTVDLCKKDSDGDGLTNGQELGDPDCVWNEGNTTSPGHHLSHPGICDPWDSPECGQRPITSGQYKNQKEWMADICYSDKFQCPVLNEPDTRNLTLRLPSGTPVPGRTTTYMCQIFDLYELGIDENTDFHMVAATPVVDNTDIVHHIVLSACTHDTVPTSEPFECGMIASKSCQSMMQLWVTGLSGQCLHPDAGIKIGGQSGQRIVAIQVHWHNIHRRIDATDSSGFQIHYTPRLRAYDAGILVVGSNYFHLPPRLPEVVVRSTCKSDCTNQMLNGSVNVIGASNHMHYAGRRMSMEVTRNGQHVQYLTEENAYNYDDPKVYNFREPFVLNPGDEIVTTCGFSTIGQNATIYSGDEITDEMCFGFITYYPKENMNHPICLDLMGTSKCNITQQSDCTYLEQFVEQLPNTKYFYEVKEKCELGGPCRSECVQVVAQMVKFEPCFRFYSWEKTQTLLRKVPHGVEFLNRIEICKAKTHVFFNAPTSPATP